MSAKQIIQDNRDKLLQILLYEKYREYQNEVEKLISKCNVSFEEWLEKILEDF